MALLWSGVFPALTTQFRADGSLDLDATAYHLSAIADSGIRGVVMLGSLGENNALTFAEKIEVLSMAVGTVGDKMPVLTGVSELSTAAAVDFVRAAEKAGVNGHMVMPAMVYRADDREALHHFRTVADAATQPLMIYNNPLAYPVDLTPHLLEQLAENEKFVAVKESSADTRRVTQIFNQIGDRLAIFGGVDDLILEVGALGAHGWVAGVGLAFPRENQALWEMIQAGEWDKALALYRWYSPLLGLDIGTKFVQKIKLCLQEVGFGTEHVRGPRLNLEGAERADAMRIIHEGLARRPSL
ncbi:MAG: dihydrodipicolinate synthase family protein [Chthonomonas sp.]|nr:dihydrodipicolinate synthase family protein [Chthonomonas sp.]